MYLVTVKDVEHTCPASVPAGGVDGALLAPHHEVIDISRREVQTGDSHRLCIDTASWLLPRLLSAQLIELQQD